MNSNKPEKLFLLIGVITFAIGVFLTISHIKFGTYFILFGIVLLGLILIPKILRSITGGSETSQNKYFPNISQSIGITAFNVLMLVFTIKLTSGLDGLIGKEALMLLSEVLIVGIPLSIAYLIRKKLTNSNSFNLKIDNLRILPFIIIGSVVLLFGIADPIGNIIPMPESFKKSIMDFGSQTGIFAFLLLVIAAPILEELLFRGIILDGLLKRYSPLTAILISSLLFGLAHLNPWSFINGLIIGTFSGWIYFKTRSVLPSIIIHASANLSGFLFKYFVDVNALVNDSLVKIYGGLTNLILSIIGSIIIVSICIYILIKVFNKESALVRTNK
ncbi:MAG: CPBP family intramembrane metalloprotease [Bacteroidales bacterium]|nr:CPBP family intramembrane metalloprotease [Bacteroidales bacterium]